MSLEDVRTVCDDFLQSNEPQALSIKGRWGVGKTFFWNEFIKEAAIDDEPSFTHYAYVSLFGITSLEELKFRLFEQTVVRSQVGRTISIDDIRHNTDGLYKRLGRRSVRLLKGIPFLQNYGSTIQSVAFLSIQNTIICIDDFERKSENLREKDVLGLVSFLKEQRDCKIVLIFDEKYLENDRDEDHNIFKEGDYKIFKEKVIDVEVSFDPTPTEVAELVFPLESYNERKLKERSVSLGINNIRILKRIKTISDKVTPFLVGMEEEVHYQALHTLTLLTWCYYSRDPSTPSFEYVTSTGIDYFHLHDREKSDQESQWDKILTEYEFRLADDFDLTLASVIKSGYVRDKEELISTAGKANEEAIARKADRSLEEAWSLFHDTFDNNEEDLVSALKSEVDRHARYISPLNLNGTVKLLRALDRDELASTIIDTYIEKNRNHQKKFDVEQSPFSHEIDDAEVNEKLLSALNEVKSQRSLDDVIKSISGKDSWNRSDEAVLLNAKEDDYYEFFKRNDGKNLKTYVRACLNFGQFGNATDEQKQIAANAKAALRRIGGESRVNEIRLQRYGIDPEEDE